MSEQEKEILEQEISDAELTEVSGGLPHPFRPSNNNCLHNRFEDSPIDACIGEWERSIYATAFPNCAATVEDGSWCSNNDACYEEAVSYTGMKDCSKAWR